MPQLKEASRLSQWGTAPRCLAPSRAASGFSCRPVRVRRYLTCAGLWQLTGGQVVGFMSGDHTDPDIAARVLIVEPVGADPVAQAAIAVVDRAAG
jgi:hypothetical protein